MDSSGDILKIIYLGFEKSQRSVTHDILRYINILTYLLTYTKIDTGNIQYSIYISLSHADLSIQRKTAYSSD